MKCNWLVKKLMIASSNVTFNCRLNHSTRRFYDRQIEESFPQDKRWWQQIFNVQKSWNADVATRKIYSYPMATSTIGNDQSVLCAEDCRAYIVVVCSLIPVHVSCPCKCWSLQDRQESLQVASSQLCERQLEQRLEKTQTQSKRILIEATKSARDQASCYTKRSTVYTKRWKAIFSLYGKENKEQRKHNMGHGIVLTYLLGPPLKAIVGVTECDLHPLKINPANRWVIQSEEKTWTWPWKRLVFQHEIVLHAIRQGIHTRTFFTCLLPCNIRFWRPRPPPRFAKVNRVGWLGHESIHHVVCAGLNVVEHVGILDDQKVNPHRNLREMCLPVDQPQLVSLRIRSGS